jgi:hypothetical protein
MNEFDKTLLPCNPHSPLYTVDYVPKLRARYENCGEVYI